MSANIYDGCGASQTLVEAWERGDALVRELAHAHVVRQRAQRAIRWWRRRALRAELERDRAVAEAIEAVRREVRGGRA